MKFSVKSVVVALALSLGATAVPAASEAQTFHGGGGVVVVRDHGHHWDRGGRRYGSRVIPRHHRRDFRGERFYRGGPRYYRDRGYYAGRRHYRDRHYYGRRHHRDGGVVIRLR